MTAHLAFCPAGVGVTLYCAGESIPAERPLPTSLAHFSRGQPLTLAERRAVGESLFELVFGGEAGFSLALKPAVGALIRPPDRQVRLQIWTDEPHLHGLPWRLISFQHQMLVHGKAPWRVHFTRSDAPRRMVHLKAPSMLVVAPRRGDPAHHDHGDRVRAVLAHLHPRYADPAHLIVAGTREQILNGINSLRPTVLYIFCDGQLDCQTPLDFEWLRRCLGGHVPELVCVHGGDFAEARRQLAEVPALVGFHDGRSTHAVANQALRWLATVWRGDLDLIDAFTDPHELQPEDAGFHGPTVVLSASQFEVTAAAGPTDYPDPAEVLDRKHQRAFLGLEVGRLVRQAQRRADAVVGLGAPTESIGTLGRLLYEELRPRPDLQVVAAPGLRLPEGRQNLPKELEKSLLDALNAQSLGQGLRDLLPHRSSARTMPLIWLDWGLAYGPPKPMTLGEIEQWLAFCCTRLAPAVPPGARLISFLATTPSDNGSKVKNRVRESLKRFGQQGSFHAYTLDPLQEVTEDDLVDYLGDPALTCCPSYLIEGLAAQILKHSKEFDAIVTLLREGRTSWPVLAHRLGAVATRSDDDEPA